MKRFLVFLFLLLPLFAKSADIRYVGGDISCLPTFENARSQYKDEKGKNISLLSFSKEKGMNAMRVRLFVNPSKYSIEEGKKVDDNDVCQDLDYILPLCKQIVDGGMKLMLDFHYSDTWADPNKQFTPDSWASLNDDQLCEQLYEYTKDILQTFKDNGVVPSFIQPGNEISYGMLWGAYGKVQSGKVVSWSYDSKWERFGKLLTSAIKACREICPKAQIILHTERVAQPTKLINFYDMMNYMKIDYDIIGLSYYPHFHGKISNLETALNTLEKQYPERNIMVVETGFSYAWEVPGTKEKVDYEYSEEGQNKFAKDLVNTLMNHEKVNGLFWWFMEYNAYPYNTTKLEGWYNAPLFDSNTGKATSAFKTVGGYGTIIPEDDEDNASQGGTEDNEGDNSEDKPEDNDNNGSSGDGNNQEENSGNQGNEGDTQNPDNEDSSNDKDEEKPSGDDDASNNGGSSEDSQEPAEDPEYPGESDSNDSNTDDENQEPSGDEENTETPENPDDEPNQDDSSSDAENPSEDEEDNSGDENGDDNGENNDEEGSQDQEESGDDNQDDAGVNIIESEFNNGLEIWYDLYGNKVVPPLKPGIYIRNRKKIIIR